MVVDLAMTAPHLTMLAGTLRRAVGKSSLALAAGALAFCAAPPAAGGKYSAPPATINSDTSYPEGPLSDGSALYYTEMGNDRVMRYDAKRGNTVLWARPDCGPTSVTRLGERLLVLCHHEAVLVEVSRSG